MVERRLRSILKTVSWRTTATVITMVVAYFVTDQPAAALQIGLLDTMIKLGAYYLHERTWLRIKFGLLAYAKYSHQRDRK